MCLIDNLFNEKNSDKSIMATYNLMRSSQRHLFILLTKQLERMQKFNRIVVDDGWDFPYNIWCGTSIENQRTANDRIPHLLATPAPKRFLSVEPLLGVVDIAEACDVSIDGEVPAVDGWGSWIDWVIVGAESRGSHAGRECKTEWVDSIVKQCKEAGVPCFAKQIHKDGKLVKEPEGYPQGILQQVELDVRTMNFMPKFVGITK